MFFFFTVFFLPILQLFLLDRGLTLTQLAIVSVIVAVVKLALEVPSGILADRWGRVRTVQLIPILYIIGIFLFISAQSLAMFIVASIFFGAVFATFSGSVHALLYDSLVDLGRVNEFKKQLGQVYLYASLGGAVSAGVSGLLYASSTTLPFLVTLGSLGGLLCSSFFFVEPVKHKEHEEKYNHLRESLRVAFSTKELRYIVVYATSLAFVFQYVFLYGQVYLQEAEVVVALIGLVYGVRLLVEGIGNALGAKYFPVTKKSFWWIYTGVVVLLLLWVMFPGLWPAFILLFFWTGAQRPLVQDFIHKRIPSNYRATIESMISFVMGLFIIALEVPLNFIGQTYGVAYSFIGILVVLAFLGLFMWRT
jgi:MFS family permease